MPRRKSVHRNPMATVPVSVLVVLKRRFVPAPLDGRQCDIPVFGQVDRIVQIVIPALLALGVVPLPDVRQNPAVTVQTDDGRCFRCGGLRNEVIGWNPVILFGPDIDLLARNRAQIDAFFPPNLQRNPIRALAEQVFQLPAELSSPDRVVCLRFCRPPMNGVNRIGGFCEVFEDCAVHVNLPHRCG